MILRSTNHVFWVDMDDTSWADSVHIQIGNPRGSPRPCVIISAFEREIVLQDLFYFSTCSSDRALDRKTGTIEMVQAALKATVVRFPRRLKVSLTDKSYFPSRTLGNIPIPEAKVLAGGPTWYQEHFGAIPTSTTSRKLQRYLIAREWPLSRLTGRTEDESTTISQYMRTSQGRLTEAEIHGVRSKLGLEALTGCEWEIPIQTVLSYDLSAAFDDNVSTGGTPPVFRKRVPKNPYIPMVHFSSAVLPPTS